MKKAMRFLGPLFLITVLSLLSIPAQAGNIVIGNNVTGAGTAEDTLTVIAFCTDSSGNFVQPDSLLLMVINPKGDSVYTFTGISSAAEITERRFGSTGRYFWSWTKAIADIDGVGVIGTYQVIIVAVDNGTLLATGFVGTFILNPTFAAGFSGMKKVFYYNSVFPSRVDSVVWVSGTTAVLKDSYWTTDNVKPDSSSSTRK